ncbi:hypothetical protein HanIR_Chr09g0399921 [Helianthus annuus]|nr:hypothetical protein HanIR_Chr09g0399921 [Helianthus annuus]
MKLQFYWPVLFAGSRRISCARNHGCESQPLVATRDHSRICRDLPVASRNRRVSSPVASRNHCCFVGTASCES